MENFIEIMDRFYRELDAEIARVEKVNADRMHCKPGCHECCIDNITVYEAEAAYIRHYHPDVLEQPPHSKGACAFLDENGLCRIYEHRPYVCRTQGLPLRWVEYEADGRMVEFRDICPLNAEGTPVELLPDDQCWDIGPFEQKLADIQMQLRNGNLKRVLLRSLFKPTANK